MISLPLHVFLVHCLERDGYIPIVMLSDWFGENCGVFRSPTGLLHTVATIEDLKELLFFALDCEESTTEKRQAVL